MKRKQFTTFAMFNAFSAGMFVQFLIDWFVL